jgi:putative ABC transport system permease protein
MMPTILRDARYAVKLLLRQKAFTAAALITLALCIGANTAIFSVLNSILLKPLPFEGADRLVRVYNAYPRAGVDRGGAAVPDYYDRLELSAFQEIAMVRERGLTLGDAGRPERVSGMGVTPSFFSMLGVTPVAGRTFTPDEGEPGGEHNVVLSWGLWQERFGGSPDALGSTIRLSDVAHTVIGVMPRDFVFEDPDVRLWVPLTFPAEMRADNARHSNSWEMIALLRPGVSVQQAQQQIDALNARNDERLPQFRELLEQVGFATVVTDYRADLTRDVRGTLWLLQAGVLLVLLIGCVNIANLVLVRATARHRELATRAALGAPRMRLVRQLLTENLVLALAGGAAGVLLAWAVVRGISGFAAAELPRGTGITLDIATVAAAFGAALLAGLIFGAIPVARLVGADLSGIFRDEGRSGTAGRGTGLWRGGLVVAQVSLAFALLVGAGLMMMSFARTLAVDPGFEPDGLLTASVSLPVTRYPDAASRHQFTHQFVEQVRALPGVTSAAVTSVLPFGEEMNASAVAPEGYEPRPDDPLIAPVNTRAGEDYFETMGIDVVAGRTFSAADVDGALPVAVVDRYLAERFWPGQDPIGKRLGQGVAGLGEDILYRTVVGVVENVRVINLTGDQPLGHYYIPLAQAPAGRFFVVVKHAGSPAGVAAGLRTAVSGLDPDLPVFDVRSMPERMAQSVLTERLRMLLLGGFGALALLLAAVGLYGVLAYSVAQRSAEIGIRMALGSTATAIFRMVVGQGARLIGIGLALGLLGSIAVGRLIASMLYGVSPTDPLILLAVVLVLSAAALVACLLPARRAMRVDPLVAMRESS